jgi:hypothetical protein
VTDLITLDGAGIADGHTMAAGDGGTGDTPVTAVGVAPFTKTTADDTYDDAFDMTPGGSTCYLRWDLDSPADELGIRFYVRKLTAWSNAQLFITAFYDGSSTGNIGLAGTGQAGQLRFIDTARTQHNSSAGVLDVDEWARIESYLDMNAGTYRLLAYAGESLTDLYDSGVTAATLGDPKTRLFLGVSSAVPASNADTRFAHLTITDDASTLIGPWGTPPPAGEPRLLLPDGSAATLKGVADGAGGLTPVNRIILT